MTTDTTTRTAAETLMDSPAFNAAIDAAIDELKSASASITAVRPGNPDLKVSLDECLARHAINKGRKSVFPYIGSGLGHGPLVELLDGSVKWDMINGIGVSMFGHSHPEMTRAALRAAMGDTLMQGNLQFNRDAIEFSQFLVDEAARTSNLKQCFLTNSGAMANE